MKLIDIKIGTQLKLGFGIILILIATLGTISLIMNNEISQQTQILYEHPLTVRRALGELKFNILSIHNSMKDLCLQKSKVRTTAILQDIANFKESAFRNIDTIYFSFLGSRKDVDSVKDSFIDWTTLHEETILLCRESKYDEALERTFNSSFTSKEYTILNNNIQDIDIFALKKGNQVYNNSIKLNEQLKFQLLVILIVIMILTFVIIYILIRNIRQPLFELSNVTYRFKQGEITARSNYLSRNEFGILSHAFNELAESIGNELSLNVQTTILSEVMLSEDDDHRFCHAFLRELIENTGSQLGVFYLLNSSRTEFIEFVSIGVDSDSKRSYSAVDYEGELGTAIASKKIMHIKEIPSNTRFKFVASSGEFTPNEMITIPIISGNDIIAIISLATIKNYNQNSIKLIQTILSTLSARLDGILAYRKIIEFSQKLEHQNRELEAQKNEMSVQTEELTEQNIELEMQKRQLDEASRLKTSFLSNMSHELRTPLNSVIALSGVLSRRLEGKVSEDEFGYLEVIERNGKQLLSLINDILDLSRIEAGREEIQITNFNMNDLVKEVIEVINPQAIMKKINLKFEMNKNIPNIESDFEKCRHILQNIVANAVKFTEQGSVEIEINHFESELRLKISDTGIGISEESLKYIFEEFRQADGTNSRKYGGTGLGLSIAKKYTEMLRGSISVESKKNVGSVFTIILPVQFKINQSKIENYKSESWESTFIKDNPYKEFNPSDKTILLVEDTEAVIIQMKDMLQKEGYNIMVARNGQEALEQIAFKIPDAMILDLMMPGVDGFEVLQKIRECESAEHLPVIILTAKYITRDELTFLKHNGIQQIIQKGDINKTQLLDAVAKMMVNYSKQNKYSIEKTITEPPTITKDKHSILIVEDNPDNMLTLKALLNNKYKIFEATDGLAGIEMAKEYRPDLILMDIALPGMNGIEALNAIRNIEYLANIPIIAVTASAMKGDMDSLLGLGFNAYISKPIDNQLLTRSIEKYLK